MNTARRNDLHSAFMAGFAASAEGFNGEYPFESRAIDIDSDPEVNKKFQKWLRALKRKEQK